LICHQRLDQPSSKKISGFIRSGYRNPPQLPCSICLYYRVIFTLAAGGMIEFIWSDANSIITSSRRDFMRPE